MYVMKGSDGVGGGNVDSNSIVNSGNVGASDIVDVVVMVVLLPVVVLLLVMMGAVVMVVMLIEVMIEL